VETRLLKLFCAVADTGSLVKAGARLHLTPSAISHALKSLETELGCRLFERLGKQMALNQAGEQLLAQIQEPLAALDAAAEGIKRLGKWGQTRLRVGAAASVCQHILPRVIRELKKAHAQLELRVESGDTPEIVDAVRENRLDLGIGIEPENSTGLEVRPLFRDELMFVFSPSHPWANGRVPDRTDISVQPLIIYQRASVTSRLMEDYFRELDIVPSTMMEVGSVTAIKELVKLNLGVSVLAPWTVESELARGTLKMRPLGPRVLRRRWCLLSRAARRLSLAEETFHRLCRNYATAMRLDRRDVRSPAH